MTETLTVPPKKEFQSLFPNNEVGVMQAGMEMKLVGTGGGTG